MKTLFVMRHAKSAWGEPGLNDFDRPILEKGKKRTQNVIHYLMKKKVNPDLVFSSPALRAMETAILMVNGLELNKQTLRVEKSIYTSDADQLEDLFLEVPRSVSEVLLIGHNPAVTDFVNKFLDESIEYMPTSGVVSLTFNINEWDEIIKSRPKLNFIVFPKMLG
ncbi:MAG: histidine phosphatase family protein [Bacteroidales bacterium]|nr:histidine phosphatase family protein [Bacteroidales bacterium]